MLRQFLPTLCNAVEVGAETGAWPWAVPKTLVGCGRAHLGLSLARGTFALHFWEGALPQSLPSPGVMEGSDSREQHCRDALCHFPCPALLKLLGVGGTVCKSWGTQQ